MDGDPGNVLIPNEHGLTYTRTYDFKLTHTANAWQCNVIISHLRICASFEKVYE